MAIKPVVSDDLSSWKVNALRSQAAPDLFLPDKGALTNAARAICVSCLVRAGGLDAALHIEPKFGLWSDTTAKRCRAMRRAGVTAETFWQDTSAVIAPSQNADA